MESWILIIEMIIEAIMKCREERQKDEIMAGIRNPGVRETWVLRRILRGEGFRGKELREKVHEGLDYARTMPQEDLVGLMDEVEARLASPVEG